MDLRTVDALTEGMTTNKRERQHADLIASRRAHVGGRLQVVREKASHGHEGLQQGMLRERVRLAFADDEVIQQAHVHALQCSFEALGQAFIRG